MNEIALMEAASSVYKRKYQCPYCNEKYDRIKLVDHIEKKHSEFIPKDFTASRIVFNTVNKKEKGKCTICGKESPWDEDKCRYDRFCSDKCKKAYEQLAAERLKRVRGMTKQEMLKDPEYQNNVMLANRSISGKYKFQDGTIRTYVGSYEHKFLEFMDKFLNVKSEDLETPGPIIEYKFKGETHKWITDAYYAPYNLAFDIKDGGDNPNKREMPEYRAKQIAKEDAIRKQGKYNYIRLTDNKFEQLIELMLELKELYIENNGEYNPIIRINESTVLESKKAKDLGPKVCSKCGSKNIGVFFQGEPIYKCKDCGEYLGVVPFNESASNDIIQNAFNSVIHTIKWCRMDDSAFCSINEYNKPKIISDNSFSAGKFAYESGIDAVVKTINYNNIFENGKYSARCDNNELIITIDKLNNMNESYIIDEIYKGDNNMIRENKSTLDPNHKTKKTDTTFKFIDLKDPSVDKYLKQDKYCTEYWDYIHKSCIGEIVIDADSDCIAGYVFLDNKKYPGFITPVVVIKKYRGYGLSSKLVKDAINKYKAIDLTVTKDNEVAIKLYKDNGFVIIGDGNSKNEYWMKLKSKLTDEEKSKSLKEFSIITPSSDKPSQEGFIGHGSWNAIKKVNGEPYRERVEVIIFNKELDKVLIGTRKSDGSVKLPGGGTDKNSSLESQAAKECQEEVKVNIDNLKYIGSYSMSNEQARYKDDVYKGQYTYLYLAIYDSDYTGYIRPEDLDSLYDTAEWMSIYDAKKLLKKRSVDLYNLFNYNYKLYINDLSYLKL
jgi:8-oxo-dGTP pyrophosphatase MutT (NUDIX family)/GNAT superfamily N-acetyltransferase/endogenous inhibitor of DNA gyrase (YacG/DUF329 family)|uniref:Acetyltransferase domain containing protein n=1 Tax=Myoviridae sp. ctcyQ27 TaxID=2825139 RepID=A0A8S5UEZ8_9CAUD|nr:MAG TPA: acetyltransferase domain containing protein [Myoviridae sp. ctcyQ27]